MTQAFDGGEFPYRADWRLPVEYDGLRETVREYAEGEIAPDAQAFDADKEFPREIFEELGELDLLGITVDEAYGGLGCDQRLLNVAIEEMARASGSVGLSYAVQAGLASKPIEQYGTEEQKEAYLEPLVAGEKVGSWALTEPSGGSDARSMKTVAERTDDGYVLNGVKTFITNGAFADVMVVKAATDPENGEISTFIVEPGEDDGVSTSRLDPAGVKASGTAQVYFDDVVLSEDRLLGAEGEGWEQTKENLAAARIGLAAYSVGLAQAAYEEARSYAEEREQFGTPIQELGANRERLAEMYRKIHIARLTAHDAAARHDEGLDATLDASITKLTASEWACDVVDEALQFHGGTGYMEETPVNRIYRDARITPIGEGVSEVQESIIAREIGL